MNLEYFWALKVPWSSIVCLLEVLVNCLLTFNDFYWSIQKMVHCIGQNVFKLILFEGSDWNLNERESRNACKLINLYVLHIPTWIPLLARSSGLLCWSICIGKRMHFAQCHEQHPKFVNGKCLLFQALWDYWWNFWRISTQDLSPIFH